MGLFEVLGGLEGLKLRTASTRLEARGLGGLPPIDSDGVASRGSEAAGKVSGIPQPYGPKKTKHREIG